MGSHQAKPPVPFDMPCPDEIEINDDTNCKQFVRSKKAFTVIPDGRWFSTLTGGGQAGTVKERVLQDQADQFPGGEVELWTLCGCGHHWAKLPDHMTIKDEADLMILALPPLSDRLLPAVPVKEEVKVTEEPTARTLEAKKKDKAPKEPKVKKVKSKPEAHGSGQDLKPKKMPVKKAGGSMPPPEPAEGPGPYDAAGPAFKTDRKRQRVLEQEPERATVTEAATQHARLPAPRTRSLFAGGRKGRRGPLPCRWRTASRTSPLTSPA